MIPSHLSWSQIQALENGRFIKNYILGETFTNSGMDFGKRLAEALELRHILGALEIKDPLISYALEFLPDFEESEKELKLEYKDTEIIGYLDGYSEDIIYEIKTGKTKWTESKAKKHGQIHLYSYMLYKQTGKIPNWELHWLSPDGEIKTFKGKCSKKELEAIEERIDNALKIKQEIIELYG